MTPQLTDLHPAGVYVSTDHETGETVFVLAGSGETFRVKAHSGAEAVAAFKQWMRSR